MTPYHKRLKAGFYVDRAKRKAKNGTDVTITVTGDPKLIAEHVAKSVAKAKGKRKPDA